MDPITAGLIAIGITAGAGSIIALTGAVVSVCSVRKMKQKHSSTDNTVATEETALLIQNDAMKKTNKDGETIEVKKQVIRIKDSDTGRNYMSNNKVSTDFESGRKNEVAEMLAGGGVAAVGAVANGGGATMLGIAPQPSNPLDAVQKIVGQGIEMVKNEMHHNDESEEVEISGNQPNKENEKADVKKLEPAENQTSLLEQNSIDQSLDQEMNNTFDNVNVELISLEQEMDIIGADQAEKNDGSIQNE